MANYPLLGDSLVDGANKPNVLFRYRPDGTGLIMIHDKDFNDGRYLQNQLQMHLSEYTTYVNNGNLTLPTGINIDNIRLLTNKEVRQLHWEFGAGAPFSTLPIQPGTKANIAKCTFDFDGPVALKDLYQGKYGRMSIYTCDSTETKSNYDKWIENGSRPLSQYSTSTGNTGYLLYCLEVSGLTPWNANYVEGDFIRVNGNPPYSGPFIPEEIVEIPVIVNVFLEEPGDVGGDKTKLTTNIADKFKIIENIKGQIDVFNQLLSGSSSSFENINTLQGGTFHIADIIGLDGDGNEVKLSEGGSFYDLFDHGVALPYRFKLMPAIPKVFLKPFFQKGINTFDSLDYNLTTTQPQFEQGPATINPNFEPAIRQIFSFDTEGAGYTIIDLVDCGKDGAILFYNNSIWKQKNLVNNVARLSGSTTKVSTSYHASPLNMLKNIGALQLNIEPYSTSNSKFVWTTGFGGAGGSYSQTGNGETAATNIPIYTDSAGLFFKSNTPKHINGYALFGQLSQNSVGQTILHEFGHSIGYGHTHTGQEWKDAASGEVARNTGVDSWKVKYSPKFQYPTPIKQKKDEVIIRKNSESTTIAFLYILASGEQVGEQGSEVFNTLQQNLNSQNGAVLFQDRYKQVTYDQYQTARPKVELWNLATKEELLYMHEHPEVLDKFISVYGFKPEGEHVSSTIVDPNAWDSAVWTVNITTGESQLGNGDFPYKAIYTAEVPTVSYMEDSWGPDHNTYAELIYSLPTIYNIFNNKLSIETSTSTKQIGEEHEGGVIFHLNESTQECYVMAPDTAQVVNYTEALSYCESYTEDGYSDWVLPTMEVMTILNNTLGWANQTYIQSLTNSSNENTLIDTWHWTHTNIESNTFPAGYAEILNTTSTISNGDEDLPDVRTKYKVFPTYPMSARPIRLASYPTVEGGITIPSANLYEDIMIRNKISEVLQKAPIFYGGCYSTSNSGELINVINPANAQGTRKGPDITVKIPFCDKDNLNKYDFNWWLNFGFLDPDKSPYPDNTPISDIIDSTLCPCLYTTQLKEDTGLDEDITVLDSEGVPTPEFIAFMSQVANLTDESLITTSSVAVPPNAQGVIINNAGLLFRFMDLLHPPSKTVAGKPGLTYLFKQFNGYTVLTGKYLHSQGLFTGISPSAHMPYKYRVLDYKLDGDVDSDVYCQVSEGETICRSHIGHGYTEEEKEFLESLIFNENPSGMARGQSEVFGNVRSEFSHGAEGIEYALLYTLGSTDPTSSIYNPFIRSEFYSSTYLPSMFGTGSDLLKAQGSELYDGTIDINTQFTVQGYTGSPIVFKNNPSINDPLAQELFPAWLFDQHSADIIGSPGNVGIDSRLLLHRDGARWFDFLVKKKKKGYWKGIEILEILKGAGYSTDQVSSATSSANNYITSVENYIKNYTHNGVLVTDLNRVGCQDEDACNYDAAFDIEDMATDACIYPNLYPAGIYNCDGSCVNDTDEDGDCDEFDTCDGGVLDVCGICTTLFGYEWGSDCAPKPRTLVATCFKELLLTDQIPFLCESEYKLQGETSILGGAVEPLLYIPTHNASSAYFMGFEHGTFWTQSENWNLDVDGNGNNRYFGIFTSGTYTHTSYDYERLQNATYDCFENPYEAPSEDNDYQGGGGCIAFHDQDVCVYGSVSTAQGCDIDVISSGEGELDFETTLENLANIYGEFPVENAFQTLNCPSTSAVIISTNVSENTLYTASGETYTGDYFYQSNASFYAGTTSNVGERLYFRNELLRKGLIAITNIDKLVLEFKNIKEKINKICTFTNP